jgi:hypothetical protein
MRATISQTWTLCAALSVLAACENDPARCESEHSGCEPDRGARDAQTPLDASPGRDAAPAPDAAADASDAPPHVECERAADCDLPEGLLRCVTCEDGSERCPETACVDRLCATRAPAACPELDPRPATCTADLDCPLRACTLKCQGDGRDACLRDACTDGECTSVASSCGAQLEPCPSGTRAAVECGTCDPGGGCAFQVIGCFQVCESDGDCPQSQPCSDGLCQFAAECA